MDHLPESSKKKKKFTFSFTFIYLGSSIYWDVCFLLPQMTFPVKERWNNMFTTGRHFYLSSPATSLVQVQGWICFCHRNCSNSFWHKFKVLETTDVCMYWHDSILQLPHIFWLHIHDGNFWSPQTELRSEDSGGYLITVDSFLCSRNQF